ncbi:hypothetical protein SEVIR_6G177350v4 [Setaria viridis]|uniref:Uncharacterized protein n=1 Tax=Setaria viridis TaxID=4556 RepID=A0A4U6UJ98_SETVI|nr:hypothetical protein SEVIR_6G177350v2 [Setaria viridis]
MCQILRLQGDFFLRLARPWSLESGEASGGASAHSLAAGSRHLSMESEHQLRRSARRRAGGSGSRHNWARSIFSGGDLHLKQLTPTVTAAGSGQEVPRRRDGGRGGFFLRFRLLFLRCRHNGEGP